MDIFCECTLIDSGLGSHSRVSEGMWMLAFCSGILAKSAFSGWKSDVFLNIRLIIFLEVVIVPIVDHIVIILCLLPCFSF